MTNRTEELKREIAEHHKCLNLLQKAELKGRQEMRDEIREWMISEKYDMEDFDAKFKGD